MRRLGKFLLSGLSIVVAAAPAAVSQISNFQHVVIMVQENRTPDNLFQGLCSTKTICSTKPSSTQYNIQTANWLDNSQPSGTIQPLSTDLVVTYDLSHSYSAFNTQCDLDTTTGVCLMDGAAGNDCYYTCLSQPQFRYVDYTNGEVAPYLTMATQYGWANYMFQTNQGPSMPAHQFLFGGTSAPSAADDAAGIFASENVNKSLGSGCIAVSGTTTTEVTPPNNESVRIYPCFEHNTIPDVLPSTVSWRYYTPSAGSIWTAPNAINHICQPSLPTGGVCEGPMWNANVILKPANVLTDIGNCAFSDLNWVIPTGQNSDHAGYKQDGGPSWVASVVNAIGQSTCKNPDGTTYWDTTAILVVWDDWGGWYDHEPPTILAQPQGDYQYGFRVPFIFISAYTPAGYIDNSRHDFGSILRFVEKNFDVTEGVLSFADARAIDSLSGFFNLKSTPRPFVTIPARFSATYFLNDKSAPLDPDDD